MQVRLLAFLDTHYHRAAHAGLMGKSPASVWATRSLTPVTEDELTDALTIRESRQVRVGCAGVWAQCVGRLRKW